MKNINKIYVVSVIAVVGWFMITNTITAFVTPEMPFSKYFRPLIEVGTLALGLTIGTSIGKEQK